MTVLVQGVICKPCVLLATTCLNGSSKTVDGSDKGLGHKLIFRLLGSSVLDVVIESRCLTGSLTMTQPVRF